MISRTNRPLRRPEYWAVVISLSLTGVFFYGIRAAAVYGLAAVTAVLTDFICLFLRGRSYRLIDLSNIGTALVFAMMLPATVPYSVALLGTVFAVAVGTHVFGYRRNYVLPPTAAGYLFVLLCWRDEVLRFPAVGERLALFGNEVTLHDSFSASVNQTGAVHGDTLDILIGAIYTPMGTGCVILLLVGIAVLLLRGQLNLLAAGSYILAIEIAGYFLGVELMQVLAGNMVLFSLLFLVADPSVMPCRTLLAIPGALCTGILVCVLIAQYHLEYAPVVAVILTCPLWWGLYRAERFILERPEVEDEATE